MLAPYRNTCVLNRKLRKFSLGVHHAMLLFMHNDLGYIYIVNYISLKYQKQSTKFRVVKTNIAQNILNDRLTLVNKTFY